MAELERIKRMGLVLRQSPEKLDFIAEVYYPFWLLTLDERGFLFDGLGTTSETFTYVAIPNVHNFVDNMERSSGNRQAYMTFLSDNINYFKVANSDEKKVIDGLIANHEFLDDFMPFLSQAGSIEASLGNFVKISPSLDEPSIEKIMEELQKLKTEFRQDVNALHSCMKLIETMTESFLKAISDEIKKVEEKFNQEILQFKSFVSKDVRKIRKEYNDKVTEYSRKIEEEILNLQREKIKLEKTKEQLADEVEHCTAEIKTSVIGKDSLGEQKWKERRDDAKTQLSDIETELKELNKRIEEVKDDKNLKTFELKSECDAKIKDAQKDLVEVESSRDAKIKIYEEEMEKFEELSSNIIQKMDQLCKLRENSIREFDELGVEQRENETKLLYMPFYLVCYQSKERKRYVTFPPSIVNSVSFSIKFKGAFGKARIKQLLQQRSQRISASLNKFPLLIEQNIVFKREISDACVKANIMRKDLLKSVRDGLEKLKAEGWLSETECEVFLQELA